MECKKFKFSSHAIQRMFERAIQKKTVVSAIREGKIIAEYPDDQPYPSYLILFFEKNRPVHVLVGVDEETRICFVITVYNPSLSIWMEDFRTRRTP